MSSNTTEAEDYGLLENKLLILYLLDKMDIPLTNSQISQFVLEEAYMSYYVLQQYLDEMTGTNYIEKEQTESVTRYSITDEGIVNLEYFGMHIPSQIRNKIDSYVAAHHAELKKDFEVTANYFYEHANDEFLVKCGVYEDKTPLLEVNLSVVSRDQAKLIVNNWKTNVNNIYPTIIQQLTTILEDPLEITKVSEIEDIAKHNKKL